MPHPVSHLLTFIASRNAFLVPLNPYPSETSAFCRMTGLLASILSCPSKASFALVSPTAHLQAFIVWMNEWMDREWTKWIDASEIIFKPWSCHCLTFTTYNQVILFMTHKCHLCSQNSEYNFLVFQSAFWLKKALNFLSLLTS